MQNLLAQLTLSFSAREENTFANFYVGSNSEIIHALHDLVAGKGERQIYLQGMPGQGVSHLLQACCYEAHQQNRTSVYLPLKNLAMLSPDMLIDLDKLDLICIDDIEAIAGHAKWEEALFHFYNKVRDNHASLIIAGHTHLPKALGIELPDLVSRITWGVIYNLQPLSDDEKLIVLNQCAARRGISLSEEVGKYILTHCPRYMTTLFSVLDVLDKASLAAQRRLTIPFVKEVLHIGK